MAEQHIKRIAELENELGKSRYIVEHLRRAGYELEERFSALKDERDHLSELVSVLEQRIELLEEARDLESARTDKLRSDFDQVKT